MVILSSVDVDEMIVRSGQVMSKRNGAYHFSLLPSEDRFRKQAAPKEGEKFRRERIRSRSVATNPSLKLQALGDRGKLSMEEGTALPVLVYGPVIGRVTTCSAVIAFEINEPGVVELTLEDSLTRQRYVPLSHCPVL